MITDEMINDWRINYGLDVSSPEDAGRWWSERNDGKAPAGAVAALGLCIEEIERLRDWQRRAIDLLTLGYGPLCDEYEPECMGCQAHALIGGALL